MGDDDGDIEAVDAKELSRVVSRHARLDLLCAGEVGDAHIDFRGA